MLALILGSSLAASAQDPDRDHDHRREAFTRLDRGTTIPVRLNESIESSRADYRVYSAFVDGDVRADNGRLAIPRGSSVELIVRTARDGDLMLDLESVTVGDHRYAVRTDRNRVDADAHDNLIGEIVGAIAGERGHSVRVPRGAEISFRLDQPLDIDVADTGVMRDGHHYHDWYRHGTN